MLWRLTAFLLQEHSTSQQRQEQQQQQQQQPCQLTKPASNCITSAQALTCAHALPPHTVSAAACPSCSEEQPQAPRRQQDAEVLATSQSTNSLTSQPGTHGDTAIRQLHITSSQQRQSSQLRSSQLTAAYFFTLTAALLGLAVPGVAAVSNPLGTCPVSIDYAVSLGEGGGDNSNVPIFVASLGITNNANVSGCLWCIQFLHHTFREGSSLCTVCCAS